MTESIHKPRTNLSSNFKTILNTLSRILKYGVPSHIIAFGQALGDNLILTILTRELYENGYKNIWIKSDHDNIFLQNNNIKHVMPFGTLLSSTILGLLGVKIVFPKYTFYHKDTDRDEIPNKHIALKMADHVQLYGAIKVKPVLELTIEEKHDAKWAKNKIIITTSTAAALFPMGNKEWSVEKYQQVVNSLTGRYEVIQLGASTDTPLSNVIDLRGKTTIRQSAAILSNAALLVSHVGFMMHLARAADCRAVIIYGGRERPDQSGYDCFTNIYSHVECSPCWFHNACPHHRKCMQLISTQVVQNAISAQLKFTGIPMKADILINK
ncbi:glycosyltransferase family 9 protein [Mucilaginibacter aquaedulcis]|uniref:glycosyltransferase family 9 protein n=1 Tax=Mucilaginibacter aquaedulcis TaxID=1187081 RepID=UPI0025B51C1A|nr:glycosyltransferase family 9 protein [Mucilaginibacter aquaedulcis]MDN3548736.1 glycosyltransferase family 9 protein [Mucilaginibacter aquaedulcis]